MREQISSRPTEKFVIHLSELIAVGLLASILISAPELPAGTVESGPTPVETAIIPPTPRAYLDEWGICRFNDGSEVPPDDFEDSVPNCGCPMEGIPDSVIQATAANGEKKDFCGYDSNGFLRPDIPGSVGGN